MNKFKQIIILLTAFTAITTYAQKVSNITFRQEQSTIIVSYDLETKTPCKVSLYVSTNGGTTWQGPLTKVTGDVGDKIISGSHNITWNVLEEFEELKGDNIKFQVKAINNEIENVTIGNQVWMKKNLDVSTYRNGDIIPEVKDPDEWKNLTTGAWCYYDNDPKNGEIYGKLYNWFAVNDPRGLAPEGFHVPTDTEWTTLTEYLGILAGAKMKSSPATLWQKIDAQNWYDANSSGFSGFPGGFRNYNSTFTNINHWGYWWSSTVVHTAEAWHLRLGYYDSYAYRDKKVKGNGFSVRCIRD